MVRGGQQFSVSSEETMKILENHSWIRGKKNNFNK